MSDTVHQDAVSGIHVAKVTSPDAIRAADSSAWTTALTVPEGGITPTGIAFDYNTMPGNQPVTYGNTVFLWQTSTPSVPTGVTPMKSWSVSPNQVDGSSEFPFDVGLVSYLLGYATGPNVKNICATSFVPASGATSAYTPSVTHIGHGATSVQFTYSVPDGMTPNSDGDWVGIWENQGVGVLYALPPKAFVPIASNSGSGNGSILNVSLRRSTPYVLGYFKGGYKATGPVQTTLAAASVFTT
jgi:hypothetical protein